MFASFGAGINRAASYLRSVCPGLHARCEEEENSILAAADKVAAADESFKTPASFDMAKMMVSPAGGHNNFDGMRITVMKLLNQNSQVMHQYIMGSSQMQGQPYYNYRAFYGTEDSTFQIGTDLDFATDGYARKQLTPNDAVAAKWGLRDDTNVAEFIYEGSDKCSSFQMNYLPFSGTFGLSFMQAVTPNLAMGGQMNVNWDKKASTKAFAALYERRDHAVVGLLNEDLSLNLMYQRRVNPNRVHLSAECCLSPTQPHTAAVAAEYSLKQARLQFSVDSNFVLRSSLESQVNPGVKLQLSTELHHGTDEFHCGYGLQMGD